MNVYKTTIWFKHILFQTKPEIRLSKAKMRQRSLHTHTHTHALTYTIHCLHIFCIQSNMSLKTIQKGTKKCGTSTQVVLRGDLAVQVIKTVQTQTDKQKVPNIPVIQWGSCCTGSYRSWLLHTGSAAVWAWSLPRQSSSCSQRSASPSLSHPPCVEGPIRDVKNLVFKHAHFILRYIINHQHFFKVVPLGRWAIAADDELYTEIHLLGIWKRSPFTHVVLWAIQIRIVLQREMSFIQTLCNDDFFNFWP